MLKCLYSLRYIFIYLFKIEVEKIRYFVLLTFTINTSIDLYMD